ncbi:hypothetical protein Q5752_001716 [Cryptotrichosporon argae]
MARFTNIGMPKKTFVSSAAEEARGGDGGGDAGPSSSNKRKPERAGWGRNPEIAKRARANVHRTDVRREARIADKQASTTCFACRQRGHAARDCPNVLEAAMGAHGSAAMLEVGGVVEAVQREAESEAGEAGGAEAGGETGGEDGVKGKKGKGKKDRGKVKAKEGANGGEVTGGKCYRCNSASHALSRCPKRIDPADPTPFATCFVCLERGHLSAACPANPRGVYVNGGSCKVCGGVSHRAKDCPRLPANERGDTHGGNAHDGDDGDDGGDNQAAPRGRSGEVVGTGRAVGADEDDFMVVRPDKRRRHEAAKNSMRGPAKPRGAEGAYDGQANAYNAANARVHEGAAAATKAGTGKPAAAGVKKKPKVVAF